MSLSKFAKTEIVILSIVFICACGGILAGLLSFNKSANVVAENAVESKYKTEGMTNVDFVDEQHNYYVSDGKTIWKVNLAQDGNGWSAQSVVQVNSIPPDAKA